MASYAETFESSAGWKIYSKSLNEVLGCMKGQSLYQWGDDDFNIAQKIMSNSNIMMQKTLFLSVLLIDAGVVRAEITGIDACQKSCDHCGKVQ